MSTRAMYTALLLGSMFFLPPSAAYAQAGQQRTAVSTDRFGRTRAADDYFYTAFHLEKNAVELAEKANYAAAIRKLNEAEKVYAVIIKDFPNWKPHLVEYARNRVAGRLKTYREKAASAPIPTGRQPGSPIATDVQVDLPSITPPRKITEGDRYENMDPNGISMTEKEMRYEIARLKEENRRVALKYAELYRAHQDIKQKLITAQKNQQMYQERYETLKKEIASEREAHREVIDSTFNDLAAAEERCRIAEKARAEAEARAEELANQLAETKAELERVTRERDELKAENEQLRAIVELNSPEKTKALLDQNLTLAEQLKEAQRRIETLESIKAGTDDQNDVLARQLEDARAEADRLREDISGIYDQNLGYSRRVSELRTQLHDLQAELDRRAAQPAFDPAMAEENQVLKGVINKQLHSLEMQEQGRKLLIETYKQIKNANKDMLEELQRLDEESKLDLTDAERRLLETFAKAPSQQPVTDGSEAVRQSLEIETLATLAQKAFTKGRYTSAEQLYRTLYDSQPDHVPGLVNLGTILLYRNKCDEAVEYFTRAARLAPDLPVSFFLAGISYYRLDKMEQAEEMFTRTLELDPANAEAFFYLANIEGISGRHELALKHFAAAVKLKPTLGDAHYNMARLYAENGRIPDAARAYDRAIHSGAEPDPEFESYLRNHPDNAQMPGVDLVEEIKPEEEAGRLRQDGQAPPPPDTAGATPPEDTAAHPDTTPPGDAPGAAEEPAPTPEPQEGQQEGTSPIAHPEQDTPPLPCYTPSQQEVLDGIANLAKKTVKAAPSPSPAGKAHETAPERFSTVRVRTRAGGYSHRVKLRMKRPEPQRLRERGKELKPVKTKKSSSRKR